MGGSHFHDWMMLAVAIVSAIGPATVGIAELIKSARRDRRAGRTRKN